MKKWMLITLSCLLLAAGTVSASSMNGKYKGEPIIKIINNGKELKADDVPAVMHDNRTLVPLYMLKQLGMDLKWDQNTYSVELRNDRAMTWAEYRSFSNKVEAYRALFFIQDQFSMMYILLTTLALEKPTNDTDIAYIKQQADKIDFKIADEIVDGFSYWPEMDKADIQSFKKVIEYLKLSKEYIYKLDSDNANIQMAKAYTLFSSLGAKYEMATFGILKSKNDEYSSLHATETESNTAAQSTNTADPKSVQEPSNQPASDTKPFSKEDAIKKLMKQLSVSENQDGKIIKEYVKFDHMSEDGRYALWYYEVFSDGSERTLGWYYVSPETGSVEYKGNN